MRLENKVALVTGAGRGFGWGWGIARALGLAGAQVCVSDITDELARAEADLQADGSRGSCNHGYLG